MSGRNRSLEKRNRRKRKNRERGKFRKASCSPSKRGWAV